MPSIDNEAAVRRAADAWNACDLDGYLELYDESIRLHGYSPEPMDKTEATGFYRGVLAALDRPRLDFHDVFGSGEKLVLRFTMSGRHVEEFLGVPATGREIALPGITILHFADGRVVERWSQADLLGFLVQAGAVPPPGA
jgi:predicted ester cyclase